MTNFYSFNNFFQTFNTSPVIITEHDDMIYLNLVQWFQPLFTDGILNTYTVEPCFYVPAIYVFPSVTTSFRSLQFSYINNALFTSILCFWNFKFPAVYFFWSILWEHFWHKMVSAQRLLISACFIMYYYHHLLVNHPTKTNMYTALLNWFFLFDSHSK
jgi:hypothetical protein